MGAERIKRTLSWGVVASLLVAALVLGQGLYQTPKYEAEARVLVGVKTKEAETREPTGIQTIPNAVSGLQTFTLTVAKMVRTMPVARAVVERLNLPRGSAEEVLGNMSVEQSTGTMLIDTTYEDSDPKRAQLIANAIDEGILVNAASPGYVATDLNRRTGTLGVEQGTPVAVRVATLPDDGPTGRFFSQDGEAPW